MTTKKRANKKRRRTNRGATRQPKAVRMVKRPKGWIKAKAVKIVGRKVYIRRAKAKGRR